MELTSMWSTRSNTYRYTLYGALFGLLFPILSTFGDLILKQLPFSLESLLWVQKSTPLHWVIDTAPFFLGLFAGFAGRHQERLVRLNETLNRRIKERDQAIDELKALKASLEERVADRTQELKRRSAHLEASAGVSHAAASILQADRLMEQAVNLIQERFGLYYVGLFVVDERDEWAVLQAGTGSAGRTMLARTHRIRIGEGMVGWSIANSQARVAQVAGSDAVRLATPELPLTRSEAALPLRSRGQVLGALTVQDIHSGTFDQDTITVLQTMADQLAVALENARLFAESKEALKVMHRAYAEMSSKAWRELLHSRPTLGFRRDKEGTAPIPTPVFAQPQLPGQADPGTGPPAHRQKVLPVKVRNQILGWVDARKVDGAGEWTAQEMDLLTELVEHLGVALENARLYETTRRHARRDRATADIVGKIRSGGDVRSILETATEELVRTLGVSRAVIKLGDPSDRSPLRLGHHNGRGESANGGNSPP